MIQKRGYSWFAAIAEERSSIVNWLLQCTGKYKYILEDCEYVESFTEAFTDLVTLLDHFDKWVQEEIIVDADVITLLRTNPVGKKNNCSQKLRTCFARVQTSRSQGTFEGN